MTTTHSMSDLRAMVDRLKYPGNQQYDPETLDPVGKVTTKRVEVMERAMPQLLAGGRSLLDIGSNKGFVSNSAILDTLGADCKQLARSWWFGGKGGRRFLPSLPA